MTLDDAYNKYLQTDKLTLFLAKNELYYKISLNYYIHQTTFDISDALEKLIELDLKIDIDTSYKIFKEIIDKFSIEDNFEEMLDEYIKMSACFQSLEDFIKKDTDLVNPHLFAKSITQTIENGTFFNSNLQQQFDEQIDETIEKWALIVNAVKF